MEFRTHWLNQQSRAAITKLGAKQDGVLRSHSLASDGTLRDTVVFSIIAIEWPAIRGELTPSARATAEGRTFAGTAGRSIGFTRADARQ